MSNKFYSFPKIGQFADTIRNIKHHYDFKGLNEAEEPIYLHDVPYPSIIYQGTVKLHGTNAGIIFHKDGTFHCQSRERIITPQGDNAGFAAFVYALPEEIMNILRKPKTAIYGEWCGGNIQGGVAIHGLSKMYVIFAKKDISIEDEEDKEQHWIRNDFTYEEEKNLNKHNIFSSLQFQTVALRIDFEHPEIAQNELIKLTEEVEQCCPVGKHFGKEGVGEGIVWKPLDSIENKNYSNSGYWFKVKGEKHSSSKHKTLAPIDVESVKAIEELVDIVLTESRVEQGINKIKESGKEPSMKTIGEFLKWLMSDIESEEAPLLNASGIERKKIYGKVSQRYKIMYMEKINKL